MSRRIALLLIVALVHGLGTAMPGRAEKEEEEARPARTRAELLQLARERHRARVKAGAALQALAARLGEGRRAGKRRQTWEAAREHANAWIFDEERFPVPIQTMITGPQEGYPEAKRRGDEAVKAWRALSRALDATLKPALALKPKKAAALERRWLEAEAAWQEVATGLDEADLAEFAAVEIDPLAPHLLALRLYRFADVAEAFAKEPPGWRRLCLFHAYAQSVLDHNEAHPFDMDAGGLAGIGGINAYRIALGISPVSHNSKLARMAFLHSEEMTKLGYFSHRSPQPHRETKEKRAKLEGYEALVVECITGIGGGEAAVEFWKYDGGHHRDMVDPNYLEAGMSTRGPAVYNGGRGEDGAIPVIRY